MKKYLIVACLLAGLLQGSDSSAQVRGGMAMRVNHRTHSTKAEKKMLKKQEKINKKRAKERKKHKNG